MYPFPLPSEEMNRALEGTEQRNLEDDILEDQDRPAETPEEEGGAETRKASDETLEKKE